MEVLHKYVVYVALLFLHFVLQIQTSDQTSFPFGNNKVIHLSENRKYMQITFGYVDTFGALRNNSLRP